MLATGGMACLDIAANEFSGGHFELTSIICSILAISNQMKTGKCAYEQKNKGSRKRYLHPISDVCHRGHVCRSHHLCHGLALPPYLFSLALCASEMHSSHMPPNLLHPTAELQISCRTLKANLTTPFKSLLVKIDQKGDYIMMHVHIRDR